MVSIIKSSKYYGLCFKQIIKFDYYANAGKVTKMRLLQSTVENINASTAAKGLKKVSDVNDLLWQNLYSLKTFKVC